MDDYSVSHPITVIIDGKNFKDLDGFYCEIDRILTKNLDWDTGHNMNAFNDLLRGGFGVHDYEQPIKLVWRNSLESKTILGEFMFRDLVNLIGEHTHIELVLA
jgi:RNAse (barnase) inhibitor barstar